MPWTAADAQEFTKKADTPAKQKRWAEVANSALKNCEGETKACEASAIKQANSVIAGMKSLEDEIAELVVATVKEVLSEAETKAGDMGDGAIGKTCTCPNCGFEAEGEPGVPCRSQSCPKCDAKLQGGDGDDNQSEETPEDSKPVGEEKEPPSNPDEEKEPEKDSPGDEEKTPPNEEEEGNPVPTEEPGEPGVETETEPSQEDPSGSITAFVMEKLRSIHAALSELFKRETYQEKEPDVMNLYLSKGWKTLGEDKQGNTWFALWPTNAYVDREKEAFATKALHDYVARNARNTVKGHAWYEHVNGSKFGTIWAEAVVADHFVCQLGTYDNTPIGQTYKAFFEKHPDSHPIHAPFGWGTSHQYDYIWQDRQDGVYEFFDIHESTVLPLHKAANIYNPQPLLGGLKEMNDEQKTTIAAIGAEVGVPDLVDQITAAGQNAKEALDARQVERKSIEESETKEEGGESPETSTAVPAVVASRAERPMSKEAAESTPPDALVQDDPAEDVVSQVVEALHLEDLSKALETLGTGVTSLNAEVAAIKSTLADLTKTEEVKKAEIAQALPRFSWIQASRAKETEIPEDVVQTLRSKAVPTDPLPEPVKKLAQMINA